MVTSFIIKGKFLMKSIFWSCIIWLVIYKISLELLYLYCNCKLIDCIFLSYKLKTPLCISLSYLINHSQCAIKYMWDVKLLPTIITLINYKNY